jgi:hypothetical protein
MSRVALYCRVSTSGQSVEPQLHALRDYAHARGLEIVGEYPTRPSPGPKTGGPAWTASWPTLAAGGSTRSPSRSRIASPEASTTS